MSLRIWKKFQNYSKLVGSILKELHLKPFSLIYDYRKVEQEVISQYIYFELRCLFKTIWHILQENQFPIRSDT